MHGSRDQVEEQGGGTWYQIMILIPSMQIRVHESELRRYQSSHILAVLQACPHGPGALHRDLDITVEGQREHLPPQDTGAGEAVQVAVSLVQKSGQEVEADLERGVKEGA